MQSMVPSKPSYSVLELVFSGFEFFTTSHHESFPNGIEWVGDYTSDVGDDLGVHEFLDERGLFVVCEDDLLTSVESTKVLGSVSDDTNDRDTETSLESLRTILLEVLLEAVNESGELSIGTGPDITGESGSREIGEVNDGEGGSTCSSTGSHVTKEEHSWLFLWVVWAENFLVEVLAGEVEGLSWEVTDDVGEVTSPEGAGTLLGDDSAETMQSPIPLNLFSTAMFLFASWTCKNSDSLDWSDEGLGNGGGNTTLALLNRNQQS